MAAEAPLGKSLRIFKTDFGKFTISLQEFCGEANRNPDEIVAAGEGGLDNVIKTCTHIQANQSRLNNWCSWQRIKAKAVNSGLAPVVEAFEKGSVPIDRLEDAFEAAYCRWWAALKIDQYDVLRTFNSRIHADKIEQFQALDDSYRSLSARYVRAKICSGIPNMDDVARNSESGKIRKVILQQRPRATVRKLIQDAPNFITDLTPCVLMSPLSIAQYLPG